MAERVKEKAYVIPGDVSTFSEFKVNCDITEFTDASELTRGSYKFVARHKNYIEDPDFDRTTGTCKLGGSPCFDLWIGSVISEGTLMINAPQSTRVSIDIKPGQFPNTKGCLNQGRLSVAVLTTDDFNATTINPATVTFGKTTGLEAPAVQSSVVDVNSDGRLDMLFQLSFPATGFTCADIPQGQHDITLNGTLRGQTLGGTPIVGTDTLQLVPGNKE